MATTIYFVKATYDDNIYKLSDFYTDSSYKQIANKSMQVDMAFNDGPTTLDTQIRILPDDTDIRDHTHIIVPSKKKIYRIDSIDEPNYDAYRLYLTDDPLIANYQNFKSQNMYLTRSNDPDIYTGLNDLPSLGTKPMSTSVLAGLSEGDFYGEWMLIFVQGLDATQKASYQKSRITVNKNQSYLETYPNLTALQTDFPELGPFISESSAASNRPHYYGYSRQVEYSHTYVDSLIYSYTLVQESGWYYRWKYGKYPIYDTVYLPDTIEFTNTYLGTDDVNDLTYTFFPDQPAFVIALPLMSCITTAYKHDILPGYFFRSLEWYNGTAWQSHNILSVKILNGISLFDEIKNIAWTDSSNKKGLLYTSLNTFVGNGGWDIPILTSSVHSLNLSINYLNEKVLDREPFKTHELWIYGQKYEIPSFLIGSLHLKQQLNVNGITYAIYKDADYKDLYISGTVSMDVQWSEDSLANWVAQNPTYKDQFNLKKQQQWAETLSNAAFSTATGAAGGSMIQGLGPMAGATMGAMKGLQSIATTAIRTSFDKKNLDLGLRNQRLLTDKLYGDTSSSYQYFNIRPGIFWIIKTMNNSDQMNLLYDTNGYPTNTITTIDALPWNVYNNTLSVYAKLIYGYFNHTIVNAYVTQSINNKMKDGIILVE